MYCLFQMIKIPTIITHLCRPIPCFIDSASLNDLILTLKASYRFTMILIVRHFRDIYSTGLITSEGIIHYAHNKCTHCTLNKFISSWRIPGGIQGADHS